MRLEEQFVQAIDVHLAGLDPVVPDHLEAVRRGRALRRRRRLAVSAGVAAVSVGVALGLGQAADVAPRPEPDRIAPVGPLDYDDGLRAFASPDQGGEVSIGGRSFPIEDMGHLDTEATATRYGLVFFDGDGGVHLLTESGDDQVLARAPRPGGFRASAQADVGLPLVAFTQPADEGVRVHLYDLEAGVSVDTVDVPCSGKGCEEIRIDGVADGLVFVRTPDGTFVWDRTADDAQRWTLLGAGEFRVASVRSGRILWAGAPPAPAAGSPVADWALTRGEIDAELSHDGRHVLYWSTTLSPTEPGGRPVRLRTQGTWFALDTDGSVLVAGAGNRGRHEIVDCRIPSGVCEPIGSLRAGSGDPMFIGNDM